MKSKGEELEWLRLYLNAWTKTAKAWLKGGVWAALMHPELEIPPRARIYVAVDAAHSYDTTVVSWAWQAADGRVYVRARVFSVRDDAPAHEYVDDFYDADSDLHVAERFILQELAPRFRVQEVVGDPNYFGRELARLGRRFETAPIFPQSNDMREYVQRFYQDAHEQRIVDVSPEGDRVLRDHVDGVEGRKTGDGYWQIKKLLEANPIDAAVAAIMATGRCTVDRRDVSVYAAARPRRVRQHTRRARHDR
jgi:phage terminase large subunit-like protein